MSIGKDLTLNLDGGMITLRVGAIIQKGKDFLMVGNDKHDYLYSVGGRIKFGETAREAVEREVYEETGVHMEANRLGFIHENFFYGDDERNLDKLIYEVSYYFYMKTPQDFEPVCDTFTDSGAKEKLVWVNSESHIKYYPEFFRTELSHPEQYVKHIVSDERKNG